MTTPQMEKIITSKSEENIREEGYELQYVEDFQWTDLAHSDWTPGFIYPSKDFRSVHSYTNENQAYAGGENVEVKDSKLIIHTRRKKTVAPAWDPKKGMVMQTFDYTSDAINNASKLAVEAGSVVIVKARCHGLLNHGIYLRSQNHIPFISVFNYTGRKIFCGVKADIKSDENKKEITGLQPLTELIYTVVWGEDEIAWFVNNIEVYRTKNLVPKSEKLYLHLYSFMFKGIEWNTSGELDVDWIRVYKKL